MYSNGLAPLTAQVGITPLLISLHRPLQIQPPISYKYILISMAAICYVDEVTAVVCTRMVLCVVVGVMAPELHSAVLFQVPE